MLSVWLCFGALAVVYAGLPRLHDDQEVQTLLNAWSLEADEDEQCMLGSGKSFSQFLHCIHSRQKRYYNGYEDQYGHPCTSYTRLSQPERRVGNQIRYLTDNALCDRTLKRRWYRFEGPAGGVMPETCVDEFRCGTHAPIWLNGMHPQKYGEVKDIEVCVSLAGHCCNRRWFIRVANCDDYYTYLLTGTPGCFMGYCIGSEIPCPPGLSSATGFSPGCSDNFPPVDGRVTLHMGQEGHKVVFYCDYEGPIPHGAHLDVEWFVQAEQTGGHMQVDEHKYPVLSDTLVERRRSVLPEGSWAGKMGSTIFCRMKGRWKNDTGVPSPPMESKKFFAGIRVLQQAVEVDESDMETEIQVQSTVPVGCLPQFKDACKLTLELAHDADYQGKYCSDGRMRQVVFGDCSINITPDNWHQVHSVKVKAVRDFYRDGNKKMMLDFMPTFSTMVSPIWNNYKPSKVEVLAKDAPTKMCSSTGDPHYSTFDGHYFHVYLEGEFVLYKNTRFPLEIHTRLEKCGETVSCNCGVAVKAADDIIVIDRCMRRNRNLAFGKSFPQGWRTLHRHALEQGGSFVKGLRIVEYDEGRRFTVHIPTGAYLEFQMGEQWINLFLYASSDDWKSSAGFCGTFDGDKSNDFTFPDGITRTYARDQEACGESPDVCKFAESWRVQPKDSFFGPVVEVPLEEHSFSSDQQYCKCEKNGDKSTVVCNYHYDVDNCKSREQEAHGSDRTKELLHRSRRYRSTDPHDEDEDYFNSEFIYDENFRGSEPTWPTPSGITQAEARYYCDTFITQSSVGRTCATVINKKLSNLIDACMIDIKVTDDLRWAVSSLTSLTSECMEEIHTDPRYWHSQYAPDPSTTRKGLPVKPVQSDGDILLERVCPAACSNKGYCERGKCTCHHGYGGSDCSDSLYDPPTISHLSNGGLCDMKSKACKEVRVFGTNFRNVSTLKCILQKAEAKPDGIVAEKVIVEVPAIFDTFEEVICHLPESDVTPAGERPRSRAYYVSISNDPSLKTDPKILIVHHSTCQICVNHNRTQSCRLKNNICYVKDRCYNAGDPDPEVCCESCQPDISEQGFTRNPDAGPPVLSPSQNTYEVMAGKKWELRITAKPSKGCSISYHLQNRAHRNLIARVSIEGVKLILNTSDAGQYTADVTAQDKCDEQTTVSYHVIVKKHMGVMSDATVAPPVNCTGKPHCPPTGNTVKCEGNQKPVFKKPFNKDMTLKLNTNELKQIQLHAYDPDGHQVEYLYVKDGLSPEAESRIAVSPDGKLSYKAPAMDHVDRYTILAMDACHASADLQLTIETKQD